LPGPCLGVELDGSRPIATASPSCVTSGSKIDNGCGR
jgi:hypothetical protein